MPPQATAATGVGRWLDEQTVARLDHAVVARLVEQAGLKPLPLVAQQVLELLRDPDYDVERLGRVFGKDPALASGVMRLANSPLYRGSEPVVEVQAAVVRLGRDAVQELLLAEVGRGLFRDATGTAAFYRAHCAAVAGVSRTLAELLAPELGPGSLAAGLLHDLGKLVLLQGGEELYKSTLDATDMREPGTVHELEREKLGFDHAALGGLMLEHWNVPAPLPEVVALHHGGLVVDGAAELRRRVALLVLADRLEPALEAAAPEELELAVEELPRKLPALEDALRPARPLEELAGCAEQLRAACREALELLG